MDLRNAHSQFLARFTAKVYSAQEAVMGEAVEVAKQNCPVESGHLRESIRGVTTETINGPSSEVVAGDETAPYAAYVENGDDPHRRPEPFMRPSVTWLKTRGIRLLAAMMRKT